MPGSDAGWCQASAYRRVWWLEIAEDTAARLEAGAQPAFPPSVVVDVKRLACELPSHADVPLARFTIPELHREVLARGAVAQISDVTLWRWLSADALQPGRHRSWIFPRDAQFAEKAGRVLDLYARTWDGTALGSNEFVISADEKPSLQARRRKHPTLAPGPARPMRVEHEYFRTCAFRSIVNTQIGPS